MTDTSPSRPQDIEALFTKRAYARTEAIKALGARGEVLLPAVTPLLNDSSKARREMGWKLLGAMRLTTDAGREAVRQVVREGLSSRKDTSRDAALEVLAQQGRDLAIAASDLAHVIATEPEEARRVRAAEILTSMGLPDAEVIAAVTPLLDSWRADSRAKADAIIRRRGGTPRPWAWEGCPLAPEVIREIQRLGGEPLAPFDPQAPRPLPEDTSFYNRERGSWRGQDPLGQLQQMPPAVWYFDEQVRWTRTGFKLWDKDFGTRTLGLAGASENFDQELNGTRRLLYVIAYQEQSQHFACIDLFNNDADPCVWSIDHDGSDAYVRWRRLSAFLEKVSAGEPR